MDPLMEPIDMKMRTSRCMGEKPDLMDLAPCTYH